MTPAAWCWVGALLAGGTTLICCVQSRGVASSPWVKAAFVAASIEGVFFILETLALYWSLR